MYGSKIKDRKSIKELIFNFSEKFRLVLVSFFSWMRGEGTKRAGRYDLPAKISPIFMQSPGEAAYIKSYIGQMYVKCSSKSRKQHRNNYYTITNKTCPNCSWQVRILTIQRRNGELVILPIPRYKSCEIYPNFLFIIRS